MLIKKQESENMWSFWPNMTGHIYLSGLGVRPNGLTGSGRLRPPTLVHFWFQSRHECTDEALAGTLKNSRNTNTGQDSPEGKPCWRLGGVLWDGTGLPVRLMDGFRTGMFKQSDTRCLGEECDLMGVSFFNLFSDQNSQVWSTMFSVTTVWSVEHLLLLKCYYSFCHVLICHSTDNFRATYTTKICKKMTELTFTL